MGEKPVCQRKPWEQRQEAEMLDVFSDQPAGRRSWGPKCSSRNEIWQESGMQERWEPAVLMCTAPHDAGCRISCTLSAQSFPVTRAWASLASK